MDWEKEIIMIFEKYGSELTLDQVYDYLDKENIIKLTPGTKLFVRKKYEIIRSKKNNFETNKERVENCSSSTQFDVSYDETRKKAIINEYVRPTTIELKLFKRVRCEFSQCTYIGDISISNEEYIILIDYLKKYIEAIDDKDFNYANIFLATALVNLGIKKYDGAFWHHLEDETGISKIDRNTQEKLGNIFVNTLIKNEKIHIDVNKYVNNILMHCFVTTNYAEDFFDFLFAYYRLDLDRDLEQNTTEMMSQLIDVMKKADNQKSRAYKIKKHTADAVLMNEKGSKIRIGNVLKYIDRYIFEDIVPEQSQNRVAKLFVEWSKNSDKFNLEKDKYASVKDRRKKHFRFPFFNFNLETNNFRLILPIQTIHTETESVAPVISWKITGQSFEQEIIVDFEESVIGYKTVNCEFINIELEQLFETINIELLYNKRIKKTFLIKSDYVRFFDSTDYNFIKYDEFIRAGKFFAVTPCGKRIMSEKIIAVDNIAGLPAFQLNVENGDVIILPTESPLPVGKPLEEGILSDGYIKNIHVEKDNNKYIVYKKAPSLYFTMTHNDKRGALIIINGEKFRFNEENASFFNNTKDKTGYILNLRTYCKENGVYSVSLSIPSERRIRNYDFALVDELNIAFKDAPYIYDDTGTLNIKADSLDETLSFNISPEEDYVRYRISNMDLLIQIPAFKWKSNIDNVWRTDHLNYVWYKELPSKLYIKFPDDHIKLFSGNLNNIDISESEITLNVNSKKNVFECDTTKIFSWAYGADYYLIKIGYKDKSFDFLKVITRNIMHSATVKSDFMKGLLIVESSISGFNDCVADVKCNNEIIAEKIEVKSRGFDFRTKFLSGIFEVVFYEYDAEEDDEFGLEEFNYTEFGRIREKVNNKFDIDGLTINLKYITRDKRPNEWFDPERFVLNDSCSINHIEIDTAFEDGYVGIISSSMTKINGLKVSVKFIDDLDFRKVEVKYFDNNIGDYSPFLFDNKLKSLALENISTTSGNVKISDRFYFVIDIKQNGGE